MESQTSHLDDSSPNVLGHLLGALEDDEQARVEALLDDNADCRRACAHWRRQLTALEACRVEYEPRPGLAARACQLVARHRATMQRWTKMAAIPCPPDWSGHPRWLDVSAVVILLLAAATVLFPALYHSRLRAHLTVDQGDLRQFGMAVAHYGEQHALPPAEVMQSMAFLPAAGDFGLATSDGVSPLARARALPAAMIAAPQLTAATLPAVCPAQPALWTRPALYGSNGAQLAARQALRISRPLLPNCLAETPTVAENAGDAVLALAGVPSGAEDAADYLVDRDAQHGWNVLFADNHVAFLPRAPQREIATIFFENTPPAAYADAIGNGLGR